MVIVTEYLCYFKGHDIKMSRPFSTGRITLLAGLPSTFAVSTTTAAALRLEPDGTIADHRHDFGGEKELLFTCHDYTPLKKDNRQLMPRNRNITDCLL
jgi:hypothetical protein